VNGDDKDVGPEIRRRPALRERKRLETKERITEAARALFRERGFDATTIDQIAEAAAVSRRSFFHYFASKDDVVFAWQDELETALTDALVVLPSREPLLRVAERAVVAAAGHFNRDEAVALSRMVHGSPVLRARNQARYEGLERVLAARLSERLGGAPDRLRARLVAMVGIGALRVAADVWLDEGGEDQRPDEYVRLVFRTLWAELSNPSGASQAAMPGMPAPRPADAPVAVSPSV
jgi:AcrR family transcriptional regulator